MLTLTRAQYSADWGDYISFAHHLRQRADADGSDLLLVDTGDRVEGNGLYDASDPKGKYTFDVFTQQNIDIITSGNHELYLANTSNNEYYRTVPAFKDSYIASNLDIYSPDTGERQALAPRFRKFTTKNQGIRIIAFGFLFDFRGNANNTVVIPVEETLKSQWFQDAIRDREVDLFVVAGHVPVRDSPEFTAVYKAIRSVQWDTPIQFFGGHTHIRDYAIYDKKSVGLESGRYMETIGFQSITGLSSPKSAAPSASLKFSRMYIDNNLYSLESHSGKNTTSFATEKGKEVSETIANARKKMGLDTAYGCAPKTLWMSRAPYPSNESLFTWLDSEVLPWIGNNVSTMQDERRPTILLTNTGAMRFDIFKGPFTVDTTFLISPFTSGLRRLRGVPYEKANKILRLINNSGPIMLTRTAMADLEYLDGHRPIPWMKEMRWRMMGPRPPVRTDRFKWSSLDAEARRREDISLSKDQMTLDNAQPSLQQVFKSEQRPRLTPGYTTHDDLSSKVPGDDTEHEPIKFYDSPPAVGSAVFIDEGHPPNDVDLVYNEFIEPWIVLALRFLGEKDLKVPGESLAGGKTVTSFLAEWIAEHWPCSDDS